MSWNKFFFSDTNRDGLVLFTFVFYILHIFATYMHGYPWSAINLYNDDLYNRNILLGLIDVVRPPNEIIYSFFRIAFVTSLLLSALGVLNRLPRIIALCLSIYFYGMKYNYSDMVNIDAHLVISLVVMAFSPIKTNLHPQVWPLRVLQMYLIFIIFTAGLLKLRLNASDWLFENAVGRALMMTDESIRYRFRTWPQILELVIPVRNFIISHEIFGQFLSIGVVFGELASPLIFSDTLKKFVLGSIIFFLILVLVFMGHGFIFSLMPLIISFINWESLAFQLKLTSLRKVFPASELN